MTDFVINFEEEPLLNRKKKNSIHFYLSLLLDAWTITYLLVFYLVGVFKADYFKFGPNETFQFLGIVINTWFLYSVVMTYQVISSCFEVFAGDIIWPWITTEVQAADKEMLPYSKIKTKYIVQNQFLFSDIKGIFSVFLSLSQVDLALVFVLSSQIMSYFFTIPRWIKNKKEP